MFYEVKEDHILLRIKAVPASSINKIAGLHDGALRIKIKAPAVEGAANKELVRFLSKTLKVSKSDIIIDKGETAKIKTIRLPLSKTLIGVIESLLTADSL